MLNLPLMLRYLFFTALALFGPSALAQAEVTTPHARVSLVAPTQSVAPGTTAWVGLRIQHQPHWHTYWRNPGESGMPTTLTWTLPAGVKAGEIAWPAPKRVPTGGLINFGYEDDVLLPVAITVPSAQIAPLTLSAKATWLICKEVCIPEEGVVSLTLPVSPSAGAPGAHAGLFEKTFAATPKPFPGKVSAAKHSDGVALTFEKSVLPGVSDAALSDAFFFPFTESVIAPSAPQLAFTDATRFMLKLVAEPNAKPDAGKTLPGVLTVGQFAYEVPNVAVADATAVSAATGMTRLAAKPSPSFAPETMGAAGGDLTLWTAIALAFFGGMILNLMPCVFPVLSIKILGFAHHAGDDKSAMRAHGLAYAAGVVMSFLALAGLLLAVRAAGSNVGWGFQLQHPVVVGVLALVFLLIGLNLLGVFEVRFAPNVNAAESKRPLVNAFSSGILAVVAASPCTAPFMGAALGFALTQSSVFSLAIFAALGLGMALPYVLLAWFPGWLKKLPRPGPWMETLKKWLSLPMFATVAWLGWVLWLQLAPETDAKVPSAQISSQEKAWKVWNQADIVTENAAGRAVFVDFTAAWCVSCQANKKLVLNTDAAASAFAAKNVTLMRADWTKQDPKITDALKALGRSGVPVYVLHRPGKAPLVLPEILTVGLISDALKTL